MAKITTVQVNGITFRSPAAARWAVFMDKLDLSAEYQTETVKLSDDTLYQPDFWLPLNKCWITVTSIRATDAQLKAARLFADDQERTVLIMQGNPNAPELQHDAYGHRLDSTYVVTAMIGSFSDGIRWACPYFYDARLESLFDHLVENGYKPPKYDGGYRAARETIKLDQDYFRTTHHREHPNWTYDVYIRDMVWSGQGLGFSDVGFYDWQPPPLVLQEIFDSGLVNAFRAVQKVRFQKS